MACHPKSVSQALRTDILLSCQGRPSAGLLPLVGAAPLRIASAAVKPVLEAFLLAACKAYLLRMVIDTYAGPLTDPHQAALQRRFGHDKGKKASASEAGMQQPPSLRKGSKEVIAATW